jgi:hypothetical protein
VLVDALGVARDRLRVLDPHPQPLAQWDRLTANALFQAHCRHVCTTHRLDELFVQGTANGLYASGALAELEIGPIAANIAGARHAARRLQQVVSNA